MNYLLKIKIKPVLASVLCIALIVTGIMQSPVMSYAVSTQEKLDQTNERLDELRKNQSELNSDLADLNDKLDSASTSLTDIQSQIDEKEKEITQLEKDIEAALKFEEEQYDAMKLRIKYMYENGSSSTAIALLLESGDMEDFLTRAEYISKISDYDRHMLEEYHNNYTTLVESREKLKEDREKLLALEDNAKKQQDSIQQLVSDTQTKIDSSTDEIAEAEALALEYEKQIEAEIIARQEAERKAAEEAARKAAEEAARKAAEEAAKNNRNNGGNSNTTVDTAAIPDGITLIQQQTSGTTINYTDNDLAMLAAIVECEAANQPYEGKTAVASVVINRMNNPRWPGTMSEVLYQPYQFTPVRSGRFAIVLARGANAACTQAALDVLNNGVTINAVFFHVVRPGETGGTVIADHIFF